MHISQNTYMPLETYKIICKYYRFRKKGLHLNTLERFHIHTEAAANNHLNDDNTISANKIFDTILDNFQDENQ
jgi:hypothetical protein